MASLLLFEEVLDANMSLISSSLFDDAIVERDLSLRRRLESLSFYKSSKILIRVLMHLLITIKVMKKCTTICSNLAVTINLSIKCSISNSSLVPIELM